MSTADSYLGLRLPKELRALLDARAESERRTPSAMVRVILEDTLLPTPERWVTQAEESDPAGKRARPVRETVRTTEHPFKRGRGSALKCDTCGRGLKDH